MRNVARALVLSLAVGTLAGCEQIEGLVGNFSFKDRSRSRVKMILDGVKEEGGGTGIKLQASVCLWWADKMVIPDLVELGRAVDAFEEWQRQGRIYPKLSSFEINTVELVQGAAPRTAIVSGTIDGKPFQMRVPDKRKISWIQRPGQRPRR